MEKELLDKTLDIIELNKKKKELLNEIANLDFLCMKQTEDYYNYADLYKKTSSLYKSKIDNISFEEKVEIEKYILDLNPIFGNPISFSHTISSTNEQYITFRKMFIDFGTKLLQLYVNKPKAPLEYVFSLLGINIDSSSINVGIDEELVNDCMVSDFTNVLYSEINQFLDCNLSSENREMLTRLKYNVIYLAPDVEKRALLTGFDIPKNPHLVDRDTIYETGLSYQEYVTGLDMVMVNWLEALIDNCLHHSDLNYIPIDLLNLVFIKAFGSTLDDYELLDCLKADYNNVCSKNYIDAVSLINEALNQCKVDAIKNKEL